MIRPKTFLDVWTRRTAPERFDTYTRWSLYSLSGFEAFVALLLLADAPALPGGLVAAWLLGALAHTVVCVALVRLGMIHFLGGPAVPRWLVTAACSLGVLLCVIAVVLFPVHGVEDLPGSSRYLGLLMGPAFTLLALAPLVTFGRLTLAGLAVAAGVGVAVSYDTGPLTSTTAGVATALFVASAFIVLGITGSYRASVWMLGVVWEQERTRVLHARLAVAEERLRFSRDLHDVFGRTLSVVAVKSELAAELAARGRDGAAEQMLEVRRIAQDALREVRSVVAGYRTADLAAELAGARSVLRSAGVETTVVGEDLPVAEPVQEALAWVVREGVTNVVRHSDATACRITLRRDDGVSVLEIVNDGVRGPAGSGSGLVGVAERLAGVAGEVTTWQEDGRFGLVARVPDVAHPPRSPAPTQPSAAPAAPTIDVPPTTERNVPA